MVCNGVVSYENHKTGLTAEEIPPSAFGISPKGGDGLKGRTMSCNSEGSII